MDRITFVKILFINTHFEIGKDTPNDNIENKFKENTTPKTGVNDFIPNYPLTVFTRRIPLPAKQGINRLSCWIDECSILTFNMEILSIFN